MRSPTTEHVVVLAVVDDPYEPGKLMQAKAAIRDDPLRAMLARNQIDTAQFNAGRMWQRYWEAVEVGGAQAVDTTKEPVDCGGFYDITAESQRRETARKELAAARNELGELSWRLLEGILGRRLSILQASAANGFITNKGIEHIGWLFRMALEELAKKWGLAPK